MMVVPFSALVEFQNDTDDDDNDDDDNGDGGGVGSGGTNDGKKNLKIIAFA